MIIQLPVTTAALEKNDDLGPSGKAEEKNYHRIRYVQ